MTRTLITFISDLHVGSSTGLCPGEGMFLDDGGIYMPSKAQLELARVWERFFEIGKGFKKIKKRILVINGDMIDGAHHSTVALATNNIQTQEAAATRILSRVTKDFDRIYVTRGTEAHVQPSAQSDERIAIAIGAEPEPNSGNRAAWQWWLDVDGVIFNIAHHIGTTSSAAYESSAVMREMVAALVEAGQWGQRVPDLFIRSHRHRYIELGIPSVKGKIQALVTPAWQLRTPYVERLDRMRMPHIGGINIIVEDGLCQIQEKIFPFAPTEMVTL